MPPNFLSDANALEQAIVMLHQLPFVVGPEVDPVITAKSLTDCARRQPVNKCSSIGLWCIERNSEDRNSFVKSLDLAISKSLQRAPASDAFGDYCVNQDFPVCGRCAQAGREIDDTSDGCVVEPVFVADPSNRCRSTGKTNSESDLVPSRSPAGDEFLHASSASRQPDRRPLMPVLRPERVRSREPSGHLPRN